MNIDIGQAFRFVFDDPEWVKKILIGGLILLIPIVGQFWLMGYMIETASNVADEHPAPLPEIQFVEQMGRGFNTFVISLVYAIPLMVLMCVMVALIGMLGGGAGNGPDDVEAMAGVMLLLSMCFTIFIALLGILMGMMAMVAHVIYVKTGSMSASLNSGAVFALFRAHLRTWIMLLIVSILAGLIAGAGGIAFGIGALFTSVLGQAMFGHAVGQVALQLPAMETN